MQPALIPNTVVIAAIGLIFYPTRIAAPAKRCNDEDGKNTFNMTQVLNQLLLERKYDKRVRPNYGSIPVTVGITMHVTTISRLSEVDMDFTLDMYFRQMWQDGSRLNYSTGCDVPVTVGSDVIKSIWTPDTFFANEKKSYFHEATSKNTFLRISPAGKILWSVRLTVTAVCSMDLKYFPMDKQKCTIEIESFGYTTEDIKYVWQNNETSVGIAKNINLPQFNLLDHHQKESIVSLSTGNYSRLSVEFQFVRNMGYYLIQIYIPASLIVVISCVSFWLSREATPARISLGVTTVLTMTTLMSSTNSQLPKISYVKSIDVYLGICFLMVFSSLLEYAAVGYLTKNAAKIRRHNHLLFQQMQYQQQQQLYRMQELQKQQNAVPYPNNSKSVPISTRQNCHVHTPLSSIARPLVQQEYSPNRKLEAEKVGGWELVGDDEVLVDVGDDDEEFASSPPHFLHMIPTTGGPSTGSILTSASMKKTWLNPSDIDKYSRVIFPLTFCCFQVMYWSIYLHVSEALTDESPN